MIDELRIAPRFAAGFGVLAWALATTAPAWAGETVLRGPAPTWVSVATLPDDKGVEQLLFETQHRLEGGTVTTYVDSAVRISTPDAAVQQGTIALGWLPDKGDLTVNRVEILRAGKSIDVLATSNFSVLRREQGLEERSLDGALTATLPVSGLQVGDILRVSHTTTLTDQALGRDMQLAQFLIPQPVRVGRARTVVSWPQDEEIAFKVEGLDPAVKRGKDGYSRIEIALPVAKRPDMPSDAPSRFTRPAVLRVGTYAGWQDLSRSMAPLFEKAAAIEEGSDLARRTDAIMARQTTPLARAAEAVATVQDEISYLLNGLGGGNYIPQAAEDSWSLRYGDCKAKSVLLLAMLRRMGIEAEPVLVVSQGGDALPELLPIPADFDHVIVHARIDGKDYWLDGTNTGTRLATIDEVPAFHYALPLTAAGSDLVPMTSRDQSLPDSVMRMAFDYSAGVDLPFLFTINLEFRGPQAATLRALAKSQDPSQLQAVRDSFAAQDAAGGVISDMKLDFDAEQGLATIELRGVGGSEFAWDKGQLAFVPDFEDDGSGFAPDRARPAWRDVPVAVTDTGFTRAMLDLTLPEGGKGYAVQGPLAYEAGFGLTRLERSGTFADGKLHLVFDRHTRQGEIDPAALPEARRAARKVAANTVKLVAPDAAQRSWDLSPEQLRRAVKPLAAVYDAAVRKARADDMRPLFARADFRARAADYGGAYADYSAILAQRPEAGLYVARAAMAKKLGRTADQVADLQRAYDLGAENEVAFSLASAMAYAGRGAEARDLLDSLSVSEGQRAGYIDSLATVAGLTGDTVGALDALGAEITKQPQNASLLNSDCWFRGLFSVALDEALDSCTKAVERSANSAPALDSRAMVRFRMKEFDAALGDLNAAIALSPGQAESRFMRGIVRLAKGEAGGRNDIAVALRIAPDIADFYARHGIVAPK